MENILSRFNEIEYAVRNQNHNDNIFPPNEEWKNGYTSGFTSFRPFRTSHFTQNDGANGMFILKIEYIVNT